MFWKSVKIWQSYIEFKGGNFLRHSVVWQPSCIAVLAYRWSAAGGAFSGRQTATARRRWRLRRDGNMCSQERGRMLTGKWCCSNCAVGRRSATGAATTTNDWRHAGMTMTILLQLKLDIDSSQRCGTRRPFTPTCFITSSLHVHSQYAPCFNVASLLMSLRQCSRIYWTPCSDKTVGKANKSRTLIFSSLLNSLLFHFNLFIGLRHRDE